MSEEQKPFHEKRRQLFLYETYYENLLADQIQTNLPFILQNIEENKEYPEAYASQHGWFAEETYKLWSLRYTAGEPLDQLRTDFTQVVEAYERYAKYDREYRQEPRTPLFDFKHIDDYVRLIQLVSLAILLRREDLIPRIHDFVDGSAFDGQDALYEELTKAFVPNRLEIDQWYHDQPYRHLLDVIDDGTPAERLTDLNHYLEAWYPNMKGCGWYNAHEHMSDEGGGGYFGYWAFEAGAVAYLLDIDDSSIDHMVYPKDLVAYARKLRDEGVASPRPDHGRLRGLPNEIVPKTGWWSTPALNAGASRYFEEGQLFPPTKTSNYGNVIWDYDPTQQPPPPPK